MAASDYIDQVQSMYISYYGRFADQSGLTYWTNLLDANAGNLDTIIQAFGTSAEATALYPATLSTAQKVTNLYNSLFGRDPDAAGLTFYTNLIGSGQATLVDIAKRVFDGASGGDATRLANKISAANNLTTSLGDSASYSGDAVAATARVLMASITDDSASISPVQNVMAAAINSAKTTGVPVTSLDVANTLQDASSPTAYTFEGHQYLFVSQMMNWADAQAYAVSKGGHLAIVNSAAENTFIFNNASTAFSSYISSQSSNATLIANDGGSGAYAWLGGNDIAQEGVWKWVDGSSIRLDQQANSATNTYANWGKNATLNMSEPDNYGGNQDALAMGLIAWPNAVYNSGFTLGVAGQWNDIAETNLMPFVVEIA